MIEPSPRLLFIPVSGRFGMGEYARSLAIANAAAARWPDGAMHFMLNRAAPYAAGSPYPATLLDASPTFHSAAVIARIESWRPDVVIFDNAGRGAQLRAARRCGARVVYISARPRQRRKAFRVRWMRLIDEHWIAYPEFIAGPLGIFERLKLRRLQRPQVRYLDVILSKAAPGTPQEPQGAPQGSLPASSPGAPAGYVLFVPGGGTGHPGAGDALDEFIAAARSLALGGVDTIVIGREAAGTADVPRRLRLLKAMPQAELAGMMRGARLIVANGGSTLLQAIACGKASVAVPIAGDQRARIRRCAGAGVTLAAALDARSIEAAVRGLLQDGTALGGLAGRARALGLADGVQVALQALAGLLRPGPGPVRPMQA